MMHSPRVESSPGLTFRLARFVLLAFAAMLAFSHALAAAEPKTVHFMSDDGTTNLVGYLYAPEGSRGSACRRHDAWTCRSILITGQRHI